MRLPIQAPGTERHYGHRIRAQRPGIALSVVLGRMIGGLAVKCESDTGDVCSCGAGKCCVAAPNGCVCQPCGGGPTGPAAPPTTTAVFLA